MKLYNSMTRAVEPFEPAGDPATVYVCGITPYDTTHLGHAFTYTTADLLIRYLEYRGHHVRYVQNVTDIDDDILKRAAQVGEEWKSLGDRWTAHFIEDMMAMNVRPPDVFPRATDVIPDIIDTVQGLLASGVAYEVDGSVYFDIHSWKGFGRLNHLPYAEMLPVANERGNRPDDPNKRDPLDFVLWQKQAPGEPSWDSPWGPGRPGWHIECSTMATRFLGQTIDVHGGGADLQFPHHECEIAQVEPLTGRPPFVRFWMHTAMVRYQGEKMSKSLGNLVMVDELLRSHTADALRLYLGRHHYRHAWEFDPEGLDESGRLAKKLLGATVVGSGAGEPLSAETSRADFEAAMDQDLDSAGAEAAVESLADSILSAAEAGADVASAQSDLRAMAAVLGLRLDAPEPESRVLEGWGSHLERFRDLSRTH